MAYVTTAAKARRILLSTALAFSLSLGAMPLPVFAPSLAMARGTPESFADLAESVVDAVVNISASQTIEEKKGGGDAMPKLAPGTPFEDMFEEFFKKRGQQGEGQRQSRKSSSLGSGFVIDSAGIVITNNHVIADANEITVIFTDGRKLKAELLGKDDKVDVAVLRVKPDKPLKAVKFGDSEKMRVGDWVMAVGNPFGLGGTVTAGIVSARGRDIGAGPYDDFLQIDAPVNRGNSGGPTFNGQGQVVGVNTAIFSPSGGSVGIGFAIPAEVAKDVIASLKTSGSVARGYIGVQIQPVSAEIAESLGLKSQNGALVAEAQPNSPAAAAGLKSGDVITAVNGEKVEGPKELSRKIAALGPEKKVELTFMRDGAEKTASVKLGTLPGEKEAKAAPLAPAEKTALASLGLQLAPAGGGKDGVVIAQIDPDGVAAQKGLRQGDVIVDVGGQTVSRPAEISNAIDAARKAGRKAVLLRVKSTEGVRFVALAVAAS